jgi:hypothetical protein
MDRNKGIVRGTGFVIEMQEIAIVFATDAQGKVVAVQVRDIATNEILNLKNGERLSRFLRMTEDECRTGLLIEYAKLCVRLKRVGYTDTSTN